MVCAAAMVSCLTVLASGDTNVTTVMTSAFQSLVDDLLSMVGGMLPIATGLFVMTLGIIFGVKWFKKLVGKA